MMVPKNPVFPNPLGTENTETCAEPIRQSLLDEKQFLKISLSVKKVNQTVYHFRPVSTSNAKNDAVFPDGLWGIDHRRPNRHWSIIQCNP